MKDIKLYIGIPCYNNSISVPTFHSLHKLSKFFYKEKIDFNIFTLGQESLIPRGRNFLASKMYDDEENYTHLLFVDADIGFEVQNLIRLIKHDKEITCGVYPKKNIYWKRLLDRLKDGKNINEKFLNENSTNFALDFEDPTNIKIKNGFTKLKHGATGFMLIKREVFKVMRDKYPELKYEADDGHGIIYDFFKTGIIEDKQTKRYASEDYYFCHLWRNIGGEVWGDLESPLTHMGSHEYHGKALSLLKKKE